MAAYSFNVSAIAVKTSMKLSLNIYKQEPLEWRGNTFLSSNKTLFAKSNNKGLYKSHK